MIIYKIRHKETGKFLKGTPTYHSYDNAYHSYDNDGRIFQTLGELRSFLTAILKYEHTRGRVAVWDIIEYELTENSVKGVHEVIKPEQLIKMLKA
jgi:hypothetical protein